jgi:hypothetical protein
MHTAPGPVKQLNPKLFLQFLDTAAQRRLRQVQFVGSLADMVMPSSRQKILQFIRQHFKLVVPLVNLYQILILPQRYLEVMGLSSFNVYDALFRHCDISSIAIESQTLTKMLLFG